MRAIQNSTQEGEIVLDLFGGSGTTLIGAEMTRRTAYLTELEPKYVDVIVNRYSRITGNIAGVCVRDGVEIPYAQLKHDHFRLQSFSVPTEYGSPFDLVSDSAVFCKLRFAPFAPLSRYAAKSHR